MDWGKLERIEEMPVTSEASDLLLEELLTDKNKAEIMGFVKSHARELNVLTEDDPNKEVIAGELVLNALVARLGATE